jgi:hypothetical protein
MAKLSLWVSRSTPDKNILLVWATNDGDVTAIVDHLSVELEWDLGSLTVIIYADEFFHSGHLLPGGTAILVNDLDLAAIGAMEAKTATVIAKYFWVDQAASVTGDIS